MSFSWKGIYCTSFTIVTNFLKKKIKTQVAYQLFIANLRGERSFKLCYYQCICLLSCVDFNLSSLPWWEIFVLHLESSSFYIYIVQGVIQNVNILIITFVRFMCIKLNYYEPNLSLVSSPLFVRWWLMI